MSKINWRKFEWPLGITLALVAGLYFAFVPSKDLTSQIERTIDGVVLIESTIQRENEAGILSPQNGTGTGFFIGENLIMTNNHVVDKPLMINVYSRFGMKPYKAHLMVNDPIADVAIIKLDDWDSFAKENPYKILNLVTSENLKIGERVLSIGHPWGYEWSVAEGIISAFNRKNGSNPQYFIQTDAKILEGNSGGPLVDSVGDVVGMNTMITVKNGGSLGFSLPGELLIKVKDDLLDGDRKVRWPTLGIAMDHNEEGQLVIADVIAGGAAEKAGIKKGDIILSLFTKNTGPLGVPVKFHYTLTNKLATLMENDKITLEIKRVDHINMIEVILGGKDSADFTPTKG